MNRLRTSLACTSLVGLGLAVLSASCSSNGPDTSVGNAGGTAAGGLPGNAGGSVGNAGGSTAQSGGTSGNAGGASGNSGGALQNTGGGVGDSGGSTGNSGGSQAGGSANVGGTTSESGGSAGVGGSGPVILPQPKLVTSGSADYWVEKDFTEVDGGTATITVDDATVFQKWLGFGGTFNEAGWDALSVLSPEERALAIKYLFDINEGAGFDWGRIPIGASDYAMDRYSLNDIPAGTTDYTMDNFSIARDREMLIPFIQEALLVKPDIRLWASPWSPPAWMKSSGSLDGTDADVEGNNATFTSSMLSDEQTLGAYALYFARFIEEYANEGITIEHIEPQNEPGYTTRYPSCNWADGLLGTFIGDHLGPTLAERGLTTEIWFGTLSNESAYPGHIAGLTGKVEDYVKGIGLQWNTRAQVNSLAARGYTVLQTEHKCGNYPWNPAGYPAFNPDQPANDHAYGEDSWGYIAEWLDAGTNIYSAWNMVLDTKGQNLDYLRPWPQNALLVVDRTAKTLTRTAAYYVFRHFSQFVDAEADRIGTSSNNAYAFKNPDGSIITIIYNPGDTASDTVLGVKGTTVEFTVPAHGWATVNYE